MTGPEVVKVWIHPNQSLNQRAETKERLETILYKGTPPKKNVFFRALPE